MSKDNRITTTRAGTKVGQSATGKVGFYGATPVVRPSASASTRATLETLGLVPAITGGAANDGIGELQAVRVTFDPSGTVAHRAIAVHALGGVLPDKAIVVGGFLEVNTALDSGGAATLAVSVNAANDLSTAAAFGGAPWSTAGRKAIVPKINTPESTSIKLTAARQVTFTVAGATLTAGKVTAIIFFVLGA